MNEQPATGGSFIRQTDGSLQPNVGAPPSAVPAAAPPPSPKPLDIPERPAPAPQPQTEN
jgi:hypothetical protein